MRRSILVGLICVLGALSITTGTFAKTVPDLDSDHDGLSDTLERAFGAKLDSADTDGDGYSDGIEVAAGYSPTSTSKTPLEKNIVIRLSTQRMEQVLGGVVVGEYVVSTGKPGMRTPTGSFFVLSKNPKAWSRSAKLWMPWWMEFSAKGYGIHELPEWPGGLKEGANHLGKAASHGCVRLGVGSAKTIYDWAKIGTRISIVQ